MVDKMATTRSAGLRPAVTPASSRPFDEIRIRCRYRLPHWEAEGSTYSITFRLADSLPGIVLASLEQERTEAMTAALKAGCALTTHERRRIGDVFSEKVDAFLDAGHGECFLANPEIARIVVNSLDFFNGSRYRLSAWCIMPNHVHVVFKPLNGRTLADILHSWKSFTANKANVCLGRKGAFWQREYYDRLIRDEDEFFRITGYVIENPVKAGLENWRWVWVEGNVGKWE